MSVFVTKEQTSVPEAIKSPIDFSKLAEDLIVTLHVSRAVLEVFYPSYYVGILTLSCLHALTSMVHRWSQATGGTGTAVRVVMFDHTPIY